MPTDQPARLSCVRCSATPRPPEHAEAYAYLLGLYLGDGHLVVSAKVPVLRIYCTSTYPGLIRECEIAMKNVLPNRPGRVHGTGCTTVQSYSKHWPCLLPQHGPGKKHDRRIVLDPWQQVLIEGESRAFLRGLFHSDGCRAMNEVLAKGKRYSYPRYFFSNKSADIMGLCQDALNRVGAQWRMNNTYSLSVARRESVALLDSFIGPKY